jgi:hypothetical protein
MNIRHVVLDWFGPSRGVIAQCPVLMYYAIEIGSSLFLLALSGVFPGCLLLFLNMDLSSLFIVGEPPHIV